jgi:hypothetical protein
LIYFPNGPMVESFYDEHGYQEFPGHFTSCHITIFTLQDTQIFIVVTFAFLIISTFFNPPSLPLHNYLHNLLSTPWKRTAFLTERTRTQRGVPTTSNMAFTTLCAIETRRPGQRRSSPQLYELTLDERHFLMTQNEHEHSSDVLFMATRNLLTQL